jgi:DNA-binding transcriptional MerR regulator
MSLKRRNDAAQEQSFYTRTWVTQVTEISADFLQRCEEEELIQVQISSSGEEGFSRADVRRLARIHRLCEDLDLDIGAVEVVLHLRRQVLDLQAQIETLEAQMLRRERELLKELQNLRRRLADQGQWQPY